VVFYDRIPRDITESLFHRGSILAHVITHEITHVLQGIERHSATGVMKARWNPEEFRSMTFRPLAFEPGDIDLIHIAMRRRETSQAGPPVL